MNTPGAKHDDIRSNRRARSATATADPEPLIPPHGGYDHLKSFHLAQLIFDVTVRFCDRYIDKRSRTHDQMVQAARSGKQNIAEGSIASGTSKKSELKLTNVARASLEELRLDYGDFLRDRGLPEWEPNHPALIRFKARRCATLEEVRRWVQDERRRAGTEAQRQRARSTAAPPASVPVRVLRSARGKCRPLAPESVLLPAEAPSGGPSRRVRGGGRFHRAALPGAQPAKEPVTVWEQEETDPPSTWFFPIRAH